MKEQKHIWLVQRKVLGMGFLPYQVHLNRKDARDVAAYFSGFSKGKGATYRVKKYTEAG